MSNVVDAPFRTEIWDQNYHPLLSILDSRSSESLLLQKLKFVCIIMTVVGRSGYELVFQIAEVQGPARIFLHLRTSSGHKRILVIEQDISENANHQKMHGLLHISSV